MGLGFRLNLKPGFPFLSQSLSNSPSRLSSSSSSVKGREGFKTYVYSSAVQIIENDYSQTEGFKVNVGKRSNSHCGGIGVIDDGEVYVKEKILRYSLLLENLYSLEESFADSDALKLERDILQQLGRLGALKLFNSCLISTLEITNVADLSDVRAENMGECRVGGRQTNHVNEEVIIRSTKKEQRKSRRERAVVKNERKAASLALCSKPIACGKLMVSSVKKVSNSKSRRLMIARNEAEMAKGVKVLAGLEKIRAILEEESGQAVGMSCWAEAAGLELKVLQHQLSFGWYCRDELVKSTRSLVLYFARNYRGMGVALEDLLQAGNMGVLQGAERFDHTRGYRFSTYVQYWIRKSMSRIVSRLARGIQIPCTLSRAINQIKKARKALSTSHGKYPDDNEIAKFTGLSLAKIESASRCLRVVGSIDQKVGESFNAKVLEFIPDTCVESPEGVVLRQHMIQDIHKLLRELDPRERQVLVLRFGIKDYQPKSLEEIGRHFHVSKEWVRRLQNKVLTKLRNEETRRNLRHYINS
ncbi:RNA polymerase sigma factor sigC [Mercurialis annua]|uniref:RNA polymerase sigma factor sigC n=1 Tax=Mercurialis annua TaxID=3986 RepID=UPI00215F425B|nr:RNA polymerase sigma factor sigC [Mercurialis annua]